MALTALAYLAGLGLGWLVGRYTDREPNQLSPGALADLYRREHQHQLDGRLPMWE